MALVGLALLLDITWLTTPHPPLSVLQFLAEHGNIAAALLHGQGFADPFGTPSGPTAWVPPVFPLYLAAVFLVFGIKTAAALRALLALDCVWAAISVFFLSALLDLSGHPRVKPWLATVLVALTLLHQQALGPWLYTNWFIAAFDAAFLAAGVGVLTSGRSGWWWLLALTGAIIPATHAGSGLACFVVVLGVWFLLARRAAGSGLPLRRAVVHTARRPLLVLAAFALPTGAWTVRNQLVFHQWIPIKSAGWFEVYLAQAYTTDGVIDNATITAHHPYSNPQLLVEYTRRGEAAFLADYQPKAQALLAADPWEFVHGILGRARSIFSYSDTASHIFMARTPMSHTDALRLVEAGLASRFTEPMPVYWTSLMLDRAEFSGRLDQLRLENPDAIRRDWLAARTQMQKEARQPARVLSGLALACLPVACLLGVFALQRLRTDPALVLAAVFYFVAVLPNVLITHYSSHQLHYLALHALFIVSFGAALWKCFGEIHAGLHPPCPS
jgi:hypothetical protein